MPEENKIKTEEKSAKKEWNFNRVLGIAAYPVSIVTGLFYAHDHVRYASLKKFRRHGEFLTNSDEWDKVKAKIKNGIESEEGVDIKDDIITIGEKFTEEADKKFAKIGYKDWLDHFTTLNRYDKVDVLEKFGTVSGITLGVLLTIANSKSLLAQINDKDDEKKEKAI